MKRTTIYSIAKEKTLYLYIITKSDGDKRGGWYTQTSSISSFCERILDRWFEKHQDSVKNIFSMDKSVDSYYTKIITQEFLSVWDFYVYIGYDHKNKTKTQLDKLITGWHY